MRIPLTRLEHDAAAWQWPAASREDAAEQALMDRMELGETWMELPDDADLLNPDDPVADLLDCLDNADARDLYCETEAQAADAQKMAQAARRLAAKIRRRFAEAQQRG